MKIIKYLLCLSLIHGVAVSPPQDLVNLQAPVYLEGSNPKEDAGFRMYPITVQNAISDKVEAGLCIAIMEFLGVIPVYKLLKLKDNLHETDYRAATGNWDPTKATNADRLPILCDPRGNPVRIPLFGKIPFILHLASGPVPQVAALLPRERNACLPVDHKRSALLWSLRRGSGRAYQLVLKPLAIDTSMDASGVSHSFRQLLDELFDNQFGNIKTMTLKRFLSPDYLAWMGLTCGYEQSSESSAFSWNPVELLGPMLIQALSEVQEMRDRYLRSLKGFDPSPDKRGPEIQKLIGRLEEYADDYLDNRMGHSGHATFIRFLKFYQGYNLAIIPGYSRENPLDASPSSAEPSSSSSD